MAMKTSWMIAAAFAGIVAGGCASDGELAGAPKLPTYTATLAPGAGITSTGKGTGTFTYDAASHTLNYNVAYSGLTGPATAAHIHGPADPGANAPPVVPFASAASPITGTATLTDAQAADLAAGKWYVNVHTAANKGGEIRGQIVKK
jgi:hypothetical protein